ncbi:MAG: YfiM family protein [Bacteroidetes bacterium]|nr:YfiM family protein [Bacteroidota bacterium]
MTAAVLLLCPPARTQSAFLPPSDHFRSDRLTKVVVTESLLFAATSIGLYYLWYKKFPKSKFHRFNDRHEWLQVDKLGHATGAYNIASMQYDLMRWSGVKENNAILTASLTSLAYMGIIEIMDGFSRDWGYSHSDMLANFSGTALFAAQQYGWGHQRINLKMSARYTPFAQENEALLGNNFASRLLKDYNGQTYWLSFNLSSFLPAAANLPDWVQLSLGYGATGMVHAKEKEGSLLSGEQTNRYRRFFLAPDVDWSRMNTSGLPAAGLCLTRFIKTPAPAIEFNNQQKIKLKWIYF